MNLFAYIFITLDIAALLNMRKIFYLNVHVGFLLKHAMLNRD